MPSNTERKIFNVRIDSVSWAELLEYCRNALSSDTSHHIVTLNGEILLKAARNPNYQQIINGADLVITDSTNVAWVSALKGNPVKTVTPGADLFMKICEISQELDKSVFLLGSAPGVAVHAASRLREQFPRLRIVGTSSADPNDEKAITQIKQAKPDTIFVAYGAPRQEEWIATHKDELNAKILIGIGGVFDMLAGKLPRAPKTMRSLHLEWLWRVIIQPSRLPRILNSVIVFPLKALFGG